MEIRRQLSGVSRPGNQIHFRMASASPRYFNITLMLQESRMLQIQGVYGEAIVI
jgi:hypothetical protein